MRCPAQSNGRCTFACRDFCCMLFSREAWEATVEGEKREAEERKKKQEKT